MKKADRLFTTVALVSGLLIVSSLMSAPVWAQNATVSRVHLQTVNPADSSRVGDVLLVSDGGTITIYGLTGSVPGWSAVVVRYSTLIEVGRGTAGALGSFPAPSENPIRVSSGAQGQTLRLEITDPTTPTVPFTATLAVDFATASGDPHKLVDIVSDTPDITFGRVLLTQRSNFTDEFEGIPGAVPQKAKIEVFSVPRSAVGSDAEWLNYRIFNTQSLKNVNNTYVSDGNINPWSIPDLSSSRPTIADAAPSTRTLYPSSKLYLRITTQAGQVYTATIQDDVTADLNSAALSFTTNNSRNPDGTFPLPAAVVAQANGPANTAEAFSSLHAIQTVGGNPVVVGSGNFDYQGALSAFQIRQAVNDTEDMYVPLGQATFQIQDRFGNVAQGVTFANPDAVATVFEGPTVTKAENDAALAAAGLIGRVQGVVEPGSILVFHAEKVDATTEGGPFWLGTIWADAADGSFVFDIPRSPSVDITLIDPAGNVNIFRTMVIDDVAQAAVVNQTGVTIGFPTTTIIGTAEPNSGITVIGLDSVSADVLNAAQTGQVVASLPTGVLSGVIAQTTSNAAGAFTVSVQGIASQIVYIQVLDRAGNFSQYTQVVLSKAAAGVSLVNFTNLNFTLNGPTVPAQLEVVVEDSQNPGTPMPGVAVVAFAEKTNGLLFRLPITDIDFPPVSQADGTLDYPLQIPAYLPDATVFNSTTLIDEFYLVARDPFTGGFIGSLKISTGDGSGFDRSGPEIATTIPLIFTDDDVQLIENGSEAPDIMNVLNIFPNFAAVGPRLPVDALNFVFVLANKDDSEEIDVWDIHNIQLLDVKPMNALLGAPYGNLVGIGLPPGYFIPIPGASNLNLGYNFWSASTQTYSGHKRVFVALMDQFGNYSPDPIPVSLDVEAVDPNPDLISVTANAVTGQDGAVEQGCKVAVYGDASLLELLAVTTANSAGGFYVSVNTESRDTIVVITRDAAGNMSNPVNVMPHKTAVPYLVMDGFGSIHTPGGTIGGGLFYLSDRMRSLAEAPDRAGVYYQLYADCWVLGPIGSSGAPTPSEDFYLDNYLGRDLEVTSTANDKVSAYVLAGNGFVGTLGDAPFFGDLVRDRIIAGGNTRVTADTPRVHLDGSIFLEDSNGNGEYDIFAFSTEDVNGNGILDPETVEFVWIDPNDPSKGMQEVIIPAEDVNGNGKLDTVFDAEGLFDASAIGIGFGADLARDLEVVYSGDQPVGYMIMDGWGVIHHYGTTMTPPLQNPHVLVNADLFRAFDIVTDAQGEVRDLVMLNGLGQVYATAGGFLGAPPLDTEIPGTAGDLALITNPAPVYFGFDIARDILVNPLDSNGDGVVGDGSDGFYVLDGYGGIHAIGAATPVKNSPFLGFDIARDLEISRISGGGIILPSQ
ncbi:MAG TPA: hypothetical protein PLG59_01250 [bacterium]|nr:hypothetical protein [bacterium]HQO33256.1 hypothetical protein [bacterium]HQP97951.1 hypothetical protein [bacterium]